MYQYRILLKFATPSPNAPKDLNTKEKEIANAVEYYNHKFLEQKSISEVELSEFITLTLNCKDLKKNPGREVNVFTQKLIGDYNWRDYSQTDRMFDATLLSEPDVIHKHQGALTPGKIFEMKTINEVESAIREQKRILSLLEIHLESLKDK